MAEKKKENTKVYQKPKYIFESTGFVNPQEAYYVPLENVVNSRNQDIKTMVDRGRYFSIFAPRQSGKTTFLEKNRELLQEDPTYIVVLLSFQQYQQLDTTEFYQLLEETLYEQLINRLKEVDCGKTETIEQFLNNHHLTNHISFSKLFKELNRIIQFKKIVVFIDEFDGIPLAELGNFLMTLRDLYQDYKKAKQKALYSVGLIGIRNITKLVVGGVSPFNIADQVEMPPFSLKNVIGLYAQYTEETNQPFSEAAVKRIHEETAGQPWLVNRLGTILTVKVKPETVDTIDVNDVVQAIKILLLERNDHFDNLYEKAVLHKETFVEIVFDHVKYHPYDEDQSWLEQYGLIKNSNGHALVANNIYKAVHLSAFFKEAKAFEDKPPNEYLLPSHPDRLDMERIILDFEQYITHIGIAAFYQKQAVSPAGATVNQQKPYEKTGRFLLTAWLYQFVKADASTRTPDELRYEVFTGLGRMDVLLTYKGRKYIIETKINRHNLTRTINDGIKQITSKYLAPEAADEGYLIIFDVKTPCGSECKPEYHTGGDKKITWFTIAIGA